MFFINVGRLQFILKYFLFQTKKLKTGIKKWFLIFIAFSKTIILIFDSSEINCTEKNTCYLGRRFYRFTYIYK